MLHRTHRQALLRDACGPFAFFDVLAESSWLSRNPIAPTIEAATERRAPRRSGVVAVLPLYGYLAQHASPLDELFGVSSTARFGEVFKMLATDEQVRAIVLDVDSPGGDATGLEALSAEIYKARASKPIIAVSNSLNASAAYYLSSAASEVVADPDSLTGSIGTVYEHVDLSEALEREGVKVSYITYGKYKAELAPGQPLTDDAREYLQGITDSYGQDFEKAVARNRGVAPAKVKADFGQGRVFRAKDAKAAGMVDRVASMQEVLAKLGGAPSAPADSGEVIAHSDIQPIDTADREQRYRQIQVGLALNLPERRARRGAAA